MSLLHITNYKSNIRPFSCSVEPCNCSCLFFGASCLAMLYCQVGCWFTIPNATNWRILLLLSRSALMKNWYGCLVPTAMVFFGVFRVSFVIIYKSSLSCSLFILFRFISFSVPIGRDKLRSAVVHLDCQSCSCYNWRRSLFSLFIRLVSYELMWTFYCAVYTIGSSLSCILHYC